MNIVRDAAKANAKAIDDPATKEKVFRNLITQESSKQSKREGGVVMRVGVRGGSGSNQHSKDASGNPGGDTRHWRYIELGTEHNPWGTVYAPGVFQQRAGGHRSLCRGA